MDEKTPRARHERVLVIDDAREIREFLVDYVLHPRGFEVLTAADGLEGLQLAFSEQPDLLIVDLQMPNMSGLELLRRLRTRRVHIPSILMTAHGSEQVAVKALRLGVRDYVIKPFVVDDMDAAIDRALRERRLVTERDDLIAQLRQANERLRQRAQELNALYSIGKSVSSSLDLETILKRVVEAAVYLSGADQGSLMLLNEQGELYVRASKSAGSAVRSLHDRIQDSEAARVLKSRDTAILGGDNYPIHAATTSKAHALAYIPLVANQRAIGVLAVANIKEDRPISTRETRVLSALASYAAGAINNAWLHQRIAAERNQLHAIINQSDNPILVVDHSRRIVVANAASRSVLDLPGGDLEGRLLRDNMADGEVLEFINQTPDTGLVRHIEVTLRSGRYRATLTPVKDIGRVLVMQLLSSTVSSRNAT